MKDKHQTINELIKEKDFKSYLEIGFGNGFNFHRIAIESKIAIDPNSPQSTDCMQIDSDSFFADNDLTFDLIFIDGDHTKEQAEKDMINSYNALNPGGVILMHDVLPFTKEMQLVPKIQEQWTGDVWRAFKGFSETYPKIKTEILPEKYGLGIIFKKRAKIDFGFVDTKTTFEEFEILMNINNK